MPHPVQASQPARKARAAALPPAERRAAIVEATLPLLLTHGSGVTSRQLAEAAGVAEGTIFRVFPDKEALVEAVVETVFDPTPVASALTEIDPSMPLETRLSIAVEIIQNRVAVIWQLMTAVGLVKPPVTPAARHDAPDLVALAALFEPERDRLRCDPIEAARLLRGVTFACSHPALVADEPLSAQGIVSLLLDGIRTP